MALDNRPLKFEEWDKRRKQTMSRFGDARGLGAGPEPAAKWSSR